MSIASVLRPIGRSEAGLIGSCANSSGVKVRRRPPCCTTSPNETDRLPATTAPLRARQCWAGTPSSFAPSSISAIRPAAPARLKIGKVAQTELLPPVIITPHLGSVSTASIRTFAQSASSSSARMRASAVPMCCPISARMTFTVTTPSPSMLYQIVGSKPCAESGRCLAQRFCRRETECKPRAHHADQKAAARQQSFIQDLMLELSH